MPTKLVDHYEIVRLVKSQINVVCAARREDRRSQRHRARRLFQRHRNSSPHRHQCLRG
ncbi:MAG: hypothetical protein M0C28_36520 [Candidatus Moduliflexus flocculans]|nr:hypothetical protein [Candidatus Moduliflexus flocculans]